MVRGDSTEGLSSRCSEGGRILPGLPFPGGVGKGFSLSDPASLLKKNEELVLILDFLRDDYIVFDWYIHPQSLRKFIEGNQPMEG